MERRTVIPLIGSVLVPTALAGCIGSGNDEEPDSDDSGETASYREIESSEHLVVDRDVLLTENGAVYVSIDITNTAETQKQATVRVQMRNRDGEQVGTPYSQTVGPIEPEEQTQLRFDIDEGPDEVGGYRIEITEEDP